MCKNTNHSKNQYDQYGFIGAVSSEFSYMSTYGFRRVKEEACFVRYESDTAFLNIYQGLSSYELGAEVGQLGVDGEPKVYSISELIRLSNLREADSYRNYVATSPEAVEAGIKKLSEIFKKYADPFLISDLNIFHKLAVQQMEWSTNFAMEILSKEVRPKAEKAFREKRYVEATRFYESIKSVLSSSENKKLKYSRKQL